jgi:hypothetical protein
MLLLKWILKKQDVAMWTGLIWLRIVTDDRSCEHGNDIFVP